MTQSKTKIRSKKKYQLEFPIRSSPKILYPYLSTPSGLSNWFADDVNINEDGIFRFSWQGSEARASMISHKENHTVRFKWLDEPGDLYFQFEIVQDDLTSDVALLITDFTNDDQEEENSLLWEAQIHALTHVIGG